MLSRAVKNLVIVQVLSIVGVTSCVLLKPHGLTANAGLSYFGNYKETIIPYAIVLLGGAWFYHKAATSLPGSGFSLSKTAFNFFAVLYIGVFITPYTLSNFVNWAHQLIGVTLFASQLLLTGWIVLKTKFNFVLTLAWVFTFLAGVLCAIYTPPPTGYLLESQMIFQLAYIIFYVKYLQIEKSDRHYVEAEITPYLLHR